MQLIRKNLGQNFPNTVDDAMNVALCVNNNMNIFVAKLDQKVYDDIDLLKNKTMSRISIPKFITENFIIFMYVDEISVVGQPEDGEVLVERTTGYSKYIVPDVKLSLAKVDNQDIFDFIKTHFHISMDGFMDYFHRKYNDDIREQIREIPFDGTVERAMEIFHDNNGPFMFDLMTNPFDYSQNIMDLTHNLCTDLYIACDKFAEETNMIPIIHDKSGIINENTRGYLLTESNVFVSKYNGQFYSFDELYELGLTEEFYKYFYVVDIYYPDITYGSNPEDFKFVVFDATNYVDADVFAKDDHDQTCPFMCSIAYDLDDILVKNMITMSIWAIGIGFVMEMIS